MRIAVLLGVIFTMQAPGAGARVKGSLLLPGAEVPAGCYLVGAIAGRAGALAP